ncbi:hypothetical protein [Salinirubrum litoreum]|uniref:Uncharacterized protein n=1 Tax=Salinirubrum litoreum TaxID=1126234 RepID=A0ABD5RBM2_9EURY|nr:hypothetical protein [Salinirubrum litoreum]
MVGPSMNDAERATASNQLKAGFVVTVALSGTFVAFFVGGSLLQIAVATVGAAILGAVLLVYLTRLGSEFNTPRNR